jgi:integrin beta 3
MKQGDVEVLVKAFAPVMRELVIRTVKPLVERIRYLEAREPARGKRGKPGRDGFDLTSFECQVLDDDRTIEFKFISGEHEHIATMKWPTVLDRGVYKAGEAYEPGDGVTWGGSWWIAQQQTDAKPDTPDSGWRLAVKRGRDGKDAKVG